MTTIAYKDNVIAYDSRMTARDVIVDDDADKKTEINGDILFFSGATSDYADFTKALYGEKISKTQMNAAIFLLTSSGDLFKCGFEDGEVWKCPIRLGCSSSIGSGCEFAMGAMDCGKTAAEAVKVAMGRDVGTGGEIRTFEIPKKESK